MGYRFWPILFIDRVWFLHSSLELGMFLRRSYFFIIIDKAINKRVTVPAVTLINRIIGIFGQVINRVGKVADFGLK